MPWDLENPPEVAVNWSEEEKKKCIEAANAVLEKGGSDEDAIYACIAAAGKSTQEKQFSNEILYRNATIGKKESDDSYELSVSSDIPINRGYYIEVLSHADGAVRLSRINAGGAVLWSHDRNDQRGVVEKFWLDGGKGRAKIRFSPSKAGQELKAEVDAGIKKNSSIAYIIHSSHLKGSQDGKDIIEAIDWEPLEISFVSIPEDFSVGIGRGMKITMETTENLRSEELSRIREIQNRGSRFKNIEGIQNKIDHAIQSGMSIADFSNELLKAIGDGAEQGLEIRAFGADIGMSQKDIEKYNIAKAIMDHANRKLEGIEAEAHEAVAKKFNLQPKRGGFFVPYEIQNSEFGSRMSKSQREKFLNRRDMLAGAFSQGGAVVPTELQIGNMIEMLRNNMVMVSAGVRVLSGLVGNILIPKKTGASTAYWVAEGAAITESTPAVGQIGMTMKTVGAMADFSWDLLRQSSLDVQAFIQSDLSETLAIEADRAILDGSGVSGQPRGILNTSGIGAVNGGSLSWADIVEFQTDVRAANVRGEDFAWISRASVWGLTQTRAKETGYPLYLSDGQTMAGYPYFITEQMPASSLIYGQFSQILVGHWGVLELVSENITQLPNRIVRVVAFMAMDVAIRQPVAFSLADGDVT